MVALSVTRLLVAVSVFQALQQLLYGLSVDTRDWLVRIVSSTDDSDHDQETHSTTTTTDNFLVVSNQDLHMIQTLVLSPEKGMAVAIGTTDYEGCPLKHYKEKDLQLSMGTTKFETVRVEEWHGYSGPLVVAYFNITEPVWEEQIRNHQQRRHRRRRQRRRNEADLSTDNKEDEEEVEEEENNDVANVSMRLHNYIAKTTQELVPLVDPALIHDLPQHRLAATVTVRKHYRHYKGEGKELEEQTTPVSWSTNHTVDRLNWWLNHYRSLGVDHFYIVDNEPNPETTPNLDVANSHGDITYIRAPSIHYDFKRCTRKKQTVSGQSILENTVIRMARAEWLVVCDVDEFLVPGEPYQDSLVDFVDHYKSQFCMGTGALGMDNRTCRPLQTHQARIKVGGGAGRPKTFVETVYEQVYAMSFSPMIVYPNQTIEEGRKYSLKTILQPSLTAYLDVHTTNPYDRLKHADGRIPNHLGWSAHLRQVFGADHNMEETVPHLSNHTKRLAAL